MHKYSLAEGTMLNELEKRKFRRLEIPIDVTAEIQSCKQTPRPLLLHNVKSCNISKTGICLETDTMEVDGVNLLTGPPYARENSLLMSIELVPEEPLFNAVGEVRWYDIMRDSTPFRYQIGVEFVDIKQNGKNQLSRFLKIHKENDGFCHRLLLLLTRRR
jgi:hypothetical protein